MKNIINLFVLIGLITLTGCTENNRAKNFGGKMNVTLPPNQKLVNVTWKEAEMWYLTRPMRADELPEVYEFKEKSNFGMFEGTVTFTETK